MKSPLAKAAVAAVVVVVCVVGVLLWRTTGSGIALADVLAQVQQSTACMYQITMTMTGKGPAGLDMNHTTEGTVLIAQDYGMKMSMGMPGANDGGMGRMEMYVLLREKAMITLMPAIKQYMRVELDETMIRETRQKNYDPNSLLTQILDCKYESLGRSEIDGVKVEGFRTTDPNCMGGPDGQVDVKIWVDVKTKLPVRGEFDLQIGEMQVHSVEHSFQWNYAVDAETFKPVIPAGYVDMTGGPIKMPAINEDGAIAGLKLCVDLTGRYPEKLDFMTVASMMSKRDDKDETPTKPLIEEYRRDSEALMKLIEEDRGLSTEERDKNAKELIKTFEELRKARQEQSTNREELLKKFKELCKAGEEQVKASEERSKKIEELTTKIEERSRATQEQIKARAENFEKTMKDDLRETINKAMPIQGSVMFYMMLAQEQKAPAYHGDVVTPQDADKVLMRWKLSDSEYRVIYGDLRAETVSLEKLTELENALPK